MIAHHDFDLGRPLSDSGVPPLADCGDAEPDVEDPERGAAAATEAVRRILERGVIPIVLGGDDSTTAIALRAYAGRGPLTILQIDAHIDYRDEVDGIRDGPSSPMRRAAEMPWVRRTIHCGTRGVGSARPAEVAATWARGNTIFTARDVRERGVARVLDEIPAAETCYIAFDCDGVDPAVMPGTATPLPGGLSYEDVSALIVGLAARGTLAGVNFAEYDPGRDVNGITALAIVRLIVRLMGAAP